LLKNHTPLYKSLIRPLFFKVDPEKIHYFTFSSLKNIFRIPGMSFLIKNLYQIEDQRLERTVFGIKFKNPVGLGAGLDKDATAIDELASFGFGFIEIGTVTPKAQPGNDKPRLFRLKEDQALINRMGFNNSGAHIVAERLKKRKSTVIIGGNIGKNKITSNEEATKDYIESFEILFDYVDYFVVNVSSPNTPGLRALQEKEPLKRMLDTLSEINLKKSKPKPILLKIAPDLTNEQLDDIISIVIESKIQGVIATNTTISRENLRTAKETTESIGNGGLSGKPLTQRSTEVIRYLHTKSNGAFPIIGVGGIHCAQDAIDKINAGASLVQIYTGFVYEGPALIKEINKAILKLKS
jgi:dihydroorotate dehydrogenase